MRVTEKKIKDLIKDICGLTGKANNKEMAIKKNQDKYLQLEKAPNYGGWRLVNVGVTNGAHYGAFGGNGTEARLEYMTCLSN